jgi:hypothetical protein
MKFTKVIRWPTSRPKHRGCNATIYQTTTYAQTSPGHPMGNMNTAELQTPRTALENALAVSRMAQEDWPFHLG